MGKGASGRFLIVDLGRHRCNCGDWHSRLAHVLRSVGAAKLSPGRHNGCDDSGVSGAAANLTAEELRRELLEIREADTKTEL
jgi:hypothetical protein